MAVEVIMPKLGMAMKEGSVSQWNKGEGDPVQKGDLIANINSEKIEMDIEAPADGTLIKISVPEGEGVPPGTVICYIGNPNEIVSTSEGPVENIQENTAAETAAAIAIDPEKPAAAPRDRIKISPVARKMAKAANLNVENIQGTGPGGRITKEDVQKAIKQASESKTEVKKEAAASPAQPQEQTQQVPVTGMRKVIASRMYESLQNSAQLTLTMKVDVTELKALQKQSSEVVEKRYENKLTITDFIARAVVLSLQQHPQMNSAYIEEKIHTYKHVHLGIAVALEKGLVVPVIRNAEKNSLIELSKNIKQYATRARDAQLSNEEMQGSTFTISSLGGYGVEFFTPILNPPEAGILGVGAVTDTPVYMGEKLERRSILPLSLTFDHRVLDGAPASAFLQTVKQFLEEPITMLL